LNRTDQMSASHSHDDTKQLLHIVIGGELADVTGVEFIDLNAVEFVGAFPSYKAAYDAWKGAAQRTVDNAHMRFFILHAHRLLDPETGTHHSV
jgi:myo-inositol-1(or 4)-monophosphatase